MIHVTGNYLTGFNPKVFSFILGTGIIIQANPLSGLLPLVHQRIYEAHDSLVLSVAIMPWVG